MPRDIKNPGVFAGAATTTIPPSPIPGTTYRDDASGLDGIAQGWPFDQIVSSAEFNKILHDITKLLDYVDQGGALEWKDDVDYTIVPAFARGSDGNIYVSTTATGPATSVEDPVGDLTGTWEFWVPTFGASKAGIGVKGNPQTNVAYQSHRDWDSSATSVHGFNMGDYFAADTRAVNPFGSDLQVGDGSQLGGFLLNHVNDFQATDQVDLGLGGNSQHYSFISQNVLLSGVQSRINHFVAVDQLGVRDTPGFGVPGFEANGPATVNNQTGLATTIRHGINAKSIHAAAGATDAGATLTSGGARSDFECPVFIRQADDSTSRTTGALVLTDGGIGCDGNVFGGNEVSANGAAPSLSLRSGAGTLLGGISHDVSNMDVINDFGSVLRLGADATTVVEILSDRLRPVTDGVPFLGDASHRWDTVFATTGTINTSDENEKDVIGVIGDALLDAWADVKHYVFKWKSAVSAKGDAARTHAGYIAQQVQNSLNEGGIDGFEYGLLCEDELTDTETLTRAATRAVMEEYDDKEETYARDGEGRLIRSVKITKKQRPRVEVLEVFNEDGTPFLVDGHPLAKQVPVMEGYQEEYSKTVKTGEKRMGLRYEQCMVVEVAYLRREIERLKA